MVASIVSSTPATSVSMYSSSVVPSSRNYDISAVTMLTSTTPFSVETPPPGMLPLRILKLHGTIIILALKSMLCN